MLPTDPAALDTPTIASALTLLTVTIKSVLDHRKGKQGATYNKGTLSRIEEKLDTFIAAQTETNHKFDKRISEVSAHVIGPDGKNGLRSRVEALEDR